jgi:hypothetical protein
MGRLGFGISLAVVLAGCSAAQRADERRLAREVASCLIAEALAGTEKADAIARCGADAIPDAELLFEDSIAAKRNLAARRLFVAPGDAGSD